MLGKRVKRLAVAAFASAALVAGGVAAAAPASASGSGNCSSGDGCLYFDVNWTGATYGLGANWANMGGLYFGSCSNGSCDGDGVQVWNNASSAANFDSSYNLCIYYNSEWLGNSDWYAAYGHPGWYGNLNYTFKNNASNLWQTGGC